MSPISEACGGGDAGRALVPGSLRGYRTWRPSSRRAAARLPDGALPLTAVTRRDVRWDRSLTARCVPGGPGTPGPSPTGPETDDHRAPQAGCVCGIYAWYDPADTYMTNAPVFGVVEASGLVLMGERGFRAEKATIRAVVTRNRRIARSCERAGIPVYRRRRDLLGDHPPEDLSSLLGDVPARDPGIPSAARPHLGGIDLLAFSVVWIRAIVIAIAFVVLPLASAVVTALATQVVTMGFLFTRLQP